jgi:hypothetical protein
MHYRRISDSTTAESKKLEEPKKMPWRQCTEHLTCTLYMGGKGGAQPSLAAAMAARVRWCGGDAGSSAGAAAGGVRAARRGDGEVVRAVWTDDAGVRSSCMARWSGGGASATACGSGKEAQASGRGGVRAAALGIEKSGARRFGFGGERARRV